jgi:ABC-2 type transport system permease protein
MPLFFASNAIYPIAIMPPWLHAIARINPLSYEVDALRSLMIPGGESVFGLGVDFGLLLLSTVLLVIIAARVYPRVVT